MRRKFLIMKERWAQMARISAGTAGNRVFSHTIASPFVGNSNTPIHTWFRLWPLGVPVRMRIHPYMFGN